MSLAPYFSKALWQGKYPIWQDYDAFRSLGLPDLNAEVTPAKVAVQTIAVKASDATFAAQQQDLSTVAKLFYGFLLGLLSYLAVIKRKSIFAMTRQLMEKANSLLPKKGS
jgi:hypothetical protein